ncbi:Nuclear pore complex protein Nup93-like isoform X1 [Oopsacas minuta]|uniref:Nuclear pore protein n=1 Tax=Oopsacas minuta TaxID=111878 RepID=A0AAV7JWA4_9METZ|nr:Nuclear pore complex protein Nup93-like isoform X1 [Oopsacas minuta]
MSQGPGSFDELLQKAQAFRSTGLVTKELPTLNRNLQQLQDAASKLLTKNAPLASKENVDLQAVKLLGSRGLEPPRMDERLAGLHATKKFDQIPSEEKDIDLSSFLKSAYENILVAAVKESRYSVQEKCEKLLWNQVDDDWDKQKEKILGALGPDQNLTDIVIERQKMTVGPMTMVDRTSLDSFEIAYAKQLYIYTDAILKGGHPDLIESFLATALSNKNARMLDIWQLIRAQTDIPNLSADLDLHSPRSLPLQSKLLRKSISYLEVRYMEFMENIVSSHPALARRTGVPGPYQLVLAYLNILLSPETSQIRFEDGSSDGKPLWAVLFFAMRCGSLREGLTGAGSALNQIADWVGYLKEFAQDGHLSHKAEAQLRGNYWKLNSQIKDPYKRAVLCILAKCDIKNPHREVTAAKTEDWLWLKLRLCYCTGELPEGQHADKQLIGQFQQEITNQFGESHFRANEKPMLYFQILCLSLQFERAIDFLWRIETLRCHAIHLAISLHQINLIKSTSTAQAAFLTDTPTGPQINLARMIKVYTRKFVTTDPREAIQYMFLLRGMEGGGEDLFVNSLAEMVWESREYELLLGSLAPDGVRKQGLIEKFHKESISDVISNVARKSENHGLVIDAIKLYDLAGNHQKVLDLLNNSMSQLISSSQSSRDTEKQQIIQYAYSLADRFKTTGHNATREKCTTFYLLLDLTQFHEYFKSGQFDVALEIMDRLGIFPLKSDVTVDNSIAKFHTLEEEIRRSLPDVILATMISIHNLYKQTQEMIGHGTADQQIRQDIMLLQEKARKLVTFAGMLPYRLSGDTSARLVQLEMMMT